MQRTPSTPPEIDGYVIERLIGSGGFADVFLYEQQLPRRRVAVKALLTHELTASARAAFTTEADLMARLSTHPYIVTIYQAGVARDGRPYLVMEYCSRPSLAERYKRHPLSVVDVSWAEVTSRLMLAEYQRFLKKYIPTTASFEAGSWGFSTICVIAKVLPLFLPMPTTP